MHDYLNFMLVFNSSHIYGLFAIKYKMRKDEKRRIGEEVTCSAALDFRPMLLHLNMNIRKHF